MIIIKIEIQKSRVMFTPDNLDEEAKIDAIWKTLIDCASQTGKLVPIGEYSPKKGNKTASFQIEGLDGKDQSFTEIRVKEDCKVYCKICNKLMDLKKGDVIPLCCGEIMDNMD